jgi:DNA polymerase-3 subunit alpha
VGEGISRKYGRDAESERIQRRVDHEISVISDMGFPEYFLVVKDYIEYAKEKGIPVGPGRGSAAGSIVAYALGITGVDPIRHDLLFERFLNSERSSLPDIDTDFCRERRDEIIEYLGFRYGYHKVAHILTVGRFGAKSALRRICRVYDLPLRDSDTLAKRLGDDLTIEESIKQDIQLEADSEKYPEIFESAINLQGFASNVGVHASGVVVSRDELYKLVPMGRSKDGIITTQWDGDCCEKVGLVKFDLLGLQTLTIISHCLKLIKERHGTDIDFDHIDLDDPAIYNLYKRGDTEGVFQCYSGGMRNLLRDINPDRFDDIAAALALYRPGPIESGIAASYCKRKAGTEKIEYIHSDAKRHLEKTYGLTGS